MWMWLGESGVLGDFHIWQVDWRDLWCLFIKMCRPKSVSPSPPRGSLSPVYTGSTHSWIVPPMPTFHFMGPCSYFRIHSVPPLSGPAHNLFQLEYSSHMGEWGEVALPCLAQTLCSQHQTHARLYGHLRFSGRFGSNEGNWKAHETHCKL